MKEAAWAKFNAPTLTNQTAALLKKDAIDHPITDPTAKYEDRKITLNYTDHASLIDKPQAGKWWYNETDGFFYYIGKLSSGSFTPNLLESLKLDSSAGLEYSGIEFDLIANLESIQNTEAAITASDGWNLAGQTDLINVLKAYCV
jgi:hypothetical protein